MDLFFDNEFRALIPPLSPEERQGLEASLRHDGNREPIIVWKETRLLLDGHHRYDICTTHNIPLKPPYELSFPDRDAAKVWVIENQFSRRNLSPYARTVLALKLEEIISKQAEQRMLAGKKLDPPPTLAEGKPQERETREQIAKRAHVSHGTVDKVKVIEEKATPEQKARLTEGETTINKVYNKIKGDSATTVAPPQPEDIRHNVSLLVGDMAQLVPTLGKFDLIIADPPYNVTDHNWDIIPDYIRQAETWLTICKEALSDHAHMFWFCSPQYAADVELIFRKLELPIKSRIVWHRRNMAMGSQSKEKFLDSWEMIFHTGNTTLNMPDKWDDSRFDVQTFAVPQTNFQDAKLHPTQKPLELIKWLVRYSAFPRSRILDPFAGSGTTGAACNSNECTLIERNEEYATLAKQRLGLE